MPTIAGSTEKFPGLFYDKGGAVFNVQHPEFGATGDGVTDDTVAIQDAIDTANTAGGGVVFLPVGTYFIGATKSLTVSSNVMIIGTGRGSLIDASTVRTLTRVIDVTGSNVVLQDFRMLGDRVGGGTSAALLRARLTAANVWAERLIFDEAATNAFAVLNDAANVYLLRSVINNSGLSSVAINTTALGVGSYIEQNKITNFNKTDTGTNAAILVLSGPSEVYIDRNRISNGNGNGVRVSPSGGLTPSRVYIERNVIDTTTGNASEGMALDGDELFVRGNRVHNANVTGILVFVAADRQSIEIVNNIISNSSQDTGGSNPAIQINTQSRVIRRLVIANNIGYDDQGVATQSTVVNFLNGGLGGSLEDGLVCGNVGRGNIAAEPVTFAQVSLVDDVIVYGNSNDRGDGAFEVVGRLQLTTVTALANDATPTVAAGNLFKTGGTTTITDFDDGEVGQTIKILSEHAITITDGTNILLNGSANFVMAAGDVLVLTMYNDQVWVEDSRQVN